VKEPRSVIVKTLVVDRDPAKVYQFFLNLKNWETGGALKNIKKKDEWWETDTPFGKARIRLRQNQDFLILDHDFQTRDSQWTVFCRVTPNERGSAVSWLFIRPEGMSQNEFESQLKNFEIETENWKKAIESK